MRALFIVLLCALPALAQGKPKFDIPEKPEPEKPAADDRRAKALDDAVRRLAGWPSARSRRAAEQLIVQRERSKQLVLDVLSSQEKADDGLKAGAAYVLGHVGDKSHFLMLLLVGAEKPQHRHAAVFLEAAWRLNPDEAVREAFRFFRISELTLRREATKFVRDHLDKRNLAAVLELLDREKAERSFTREIGLTLLDRLVATKEVSWDEAGPRFYVVLGDDSPQVAARAMRILASRNDKQNIAALNNLITKKFSHWRQRSYAALALSILSSAFRVDALTPEAIETLRGRHGLEHPKEMLAQASAALALGVAALRGGDQELVRLLDKQIPITLIEAVGAGNRHYRDFASVMPLAYLMLRRITGQAFPDNAPRWAQWWKDNGHRFRARRELREVDARDLAETVVEVRAPRDGGGVAMRFSVVGEQRPTFLKGRAYALPAEQMDGFAQLLRESGFFTATEADPGSTKSGELLVVMRLGDLQRIVAFPPPSEENKTQGRILDRARALADAFAWQLWWDRRAQPSWALFFGENHKWFLANTNEQARADRLRGMIAGSLRDQLLLDDRLRAVRAAADLPGGGKALTEKQVAEFIDSAGLEVEPNEFVAAVVELLVPDAGPVAADALMALLATRADPRALDMLTGLCASLDTARLAKLAGDERWKVRRAAVAGLARREGARDVLVGRLQDSEVQVRAAAAEALAHGKDVAILPTLMELSRHPSSEVRAKTAYAYGLLGGTGLKLIRPLLYTDPDIRVRTRAIDGLVEGKDAGSSDLLVGVFERETDGRVRAAASRGLVQLESPVLVAKLMARLEQTPSASPERVAIVNVLARFDSDRPVSLLQSVLAGDDRASADAAALGLARRWDDSAIGQLIRMVESGGDNARTGIRHLQLLASYATDAETFEAQADNYKGWYKVNSTGYPRKWFADALKPRGYDTSVLDGFLETPGVEIPPIPDAVVPILLRALREDVWYLRRNASFLLNRRIGAGAPEVVSYNTSPDELEKAVRFYVDWWGEEQKRIEAKKRQ